MLQFWSYFQFAGLCMKVLFLLIIHKYDCDVANSYLHT